MYFQTLDDKRECVGVYCEGDLQFKDVPAGLTKTWKYTGSVTGTEIEYGWILCNGSELAEVCPENLKQELERLQRKFNAYMKAFRIANVNLRENCIFELVPYDFLKEFCEMKNKITSHVFENFDKPKNYKMMSDAHKLIHKISYQDLNIDVSGCRDLFLNSATAKKVNSIVNGPKHIDYDLFGTVTGRLTTKRNSFPILTMKREHRKILKPKNDWFISLDYNSAEVRTLIALSGKPQPDIDIHEWHCHNLFKGEEGVTRARAKTMFFAWLYNPASKKIKMDFYDREGLLEEWYREGVIHTPIGREIKVGRDKAFNYLIQSTTADLVIERAVALDRMLEGKKSFISHILHDEVVVDFCDSERAILKDIKKLFAKNLLSDYMVNVKAGKNYYELSELDV